jgi:hypothetical protein
MLNDGARGVEHQKPQPLRLRIGHISRQGQPLECAEQVIREHIEPEPDGVGHKLPTRQGRGCQLIPDSAIEDTSQSPCFKMP